MKTLIALAAFLTFATGVSALEATRLFETLEPSVVLITSEEGTGSGVVITADGLILTNFHVANTPLPMTVEAIVGEQGRRVRKSFPNIRLHKVHVRSDLALLKLDAPGIQFIPARLSKSSADAKSGAICYALGFPYLPQQNKPVITITKGIVNSTRREISGSAYLQLDAAINPGNSGGALVNEDGVLIGIPTLRYEGADRVGLATPILGLRMDEFVPIKERKGDAAEAARLARMADVYLLRDGLSFGSDPESAVTALGLLREALGIDPNNAQWSFLVASLYLRLEAVPPARAYAENAVRIDPAHLRARLLLAGIHDRLKESEAASVQYFACLPLLDEKSDKSIRSEVFRRLIDHLSAAGDAVRLLYVISWARTSLGEPITPAQELAIQRAGPAVADKLAQSLLAKSAGHNVAEMQKLARENPSQPIKASEPFKPADISKVRDETVNNAVITSNVQFKSGDTARLADAPAGVVYKPDQGILEWTLPPFSKASEARVLFLLTHPDGSEEPYIHTISRK